MIACQVVSNGTTVSWTGLSLNYQADARTNEWFAAASAGDVPAATPMTITTGGGTVKTAGIFLRIS